MAYPLRHPAETFQYSLGNRNALEWVIDQYQVKQDKRSGIRSDPNRADDEEYIVRLVGQVVRVSQETVQIAAMVVRTERNFLFLSIRFFAVRQYCS